MYKGNKTKSNDSIAKDTRPDKSNKKYSKRKSKKVTKVEDTKEVLDPKGRDNDPNWYFSDAAMADQVTQMAFQQLAGYPIEIFGQQWDVPNIVRINMNPSPGVTRSDDYANPSLNQMTGINLAGFRLFSKLSAYTGRIATYGPQDISTMILAFGEVISVMEWMRRTFGIANAYNMRNRDFPVNALNYGCLTDADDFFANFANYRTRFNGLITMVNQLPIPKGISYFDKCAALYERLYLDDNSSMAQTLITAPFSTWILDETSSSDGSVLKTVPWMAIEDASNAQYLDSVRHTARNFSYYLDQADLMIGALLNSSTLQVVYTDLLNLANKVGQEFWRLDYLADGYLVVPEYNMGFLLQMHNATIAGPPTNHQELSVYHITNWNDVIPNPNGNTLYYNPGFNTLGNISNGLPHTGNGVLIDMLSDTPTVEDRVEVTRYTSISGVRYYNKIVVWPGTASVQNGGLFDATLPDHWVVSISFKIQNAAKQEVADNCAATIVRETLYKQYVAYASNIDWAPRFYEADDASTGFTGLYMGDLNYYTVVDAEYLRKIHQFVSLALYDIR